jgi:hypothetical protein
VSCRKYAGDNPVISKYRLGLSAFAVAMALSCAACGSSSKPAASGSATSGSAASGSVTSKAATAGGSPGSTTIAFLARNPCQVVSGAQAQAILGQPLTAGVVNDLGNGFSCEYDMTGSISVYSIAIIAESLADANSIQPAPPVPGLRQPANCSQKAGFVGAIDATHALEVNGPSCKVDEEIARVAYVKL